jgi:hypothetical protein
MDTLFATLRPEEFVPPPVTELIAPPPRPPLIFEPEVYRPRPLLTPESDGFLGGAPTSRPAEECDIEFYAVTVGGSGELGFGAAPRTIIKTVSRNCPQLNT